MYGSVLKVCCLINEKLCVKYCCTLSVVKKIGPMFFCAIYFSLCFVFLFLLLVISKDAKDVIFHPRVTYISQSQRAVLFPEALIHWPFIALN